MLVTTLKKPRLLSVIASPGYDLVVETPGFDFRTVFEGTKSGSIPKGSVIWKVKKQTDVPLRFGVGIIHPEERAANGRGVLESVNGIFTFKVVNPEVLVRLCNTISIEEFRQTFLLPRISSAVRGLLCGHSGDIKKVIYTIQISRDDETSPIDREFANLGLTLNDFIIEG